MRCSSEEGVCRPSRALILLAHYPALTRWAESYAALTGWVRAYKALTHRGKCVAINDRTFNVLLTLLRPLESGGRGAGFRQRLRLADSTSLHNGVNSIRRETT